MAAGALPASAHFQPPTPTPTPAPRSIPCVKAADGSHTPLSASPKGNEAWVLLLEKAFARYMSSYAAMEGGLQASAFKALSGDGEKGLLLYMTDAVGGLAWRVGPRCGGLEAGRAAPGPWAMRWMAWCGGRRGGGGGGGGGGAGAGAAQLGSAGFRT